MIKRTPISDHGQVCIININIAIFRPFCFKFLLFLLISWSIIVILIYLKRYETLQILIQKIDKLYENCDKRLNDIENDFNEVK